MNFPPSSADHSEFNDDIMGHGSVADDYEASLKAFEGARGTVPDWMIVEQKESYEVALRSLGFEPDKHK